MTQHIQTRHLTHENLCDLLLAEEDAAQDIRRDHLSECLICAAELDLLRTSAASFRSASITIANRVQAGRPNHARLVLLTSRPRQSFIWATAALIFAAALPMGLYQQIIRDQQNIRSHFQPRAVVTAQPSASSTLRVSTLESDEALLESINQDLSASIPSSMKSLTGPYASPSSDPSLETNSNPRKN